MLSVFAVAFIVSAAGVEDGHAFLGIASTPTLAACMAEATEVAMAPGQNLPVGEHIVVVCTDPNTGKTARYEFLYGGKSA